MMHPNNQFKLAARIKALACFVLLCGPVAAVAATPQVPIAMNQPQVVATAVNPGMERIEVPFDIGASDSIRFEVIAPVAGATFTLKNPAGAPVYLPGDGSVSVLPGNSQTPPIPGSAFLTPEIAAPMDGIWTVVIDFPAATEKTLSLATLLINSPIRAGLVLEKPVYRKGEQAQIGMLVLDQGTPILGLSPSVSVVTPAGNSVGINVADNGQAANLDGLANDGLYSGAYTFDTVGTHKVVGTVVVPTAEGAALRPASATVKVTEPYLENVQVATSLSQGAAGCIAAVNLTITGDVLQDATYAGKAVLSADNGAHISAQASQDFSAHNRMSLNVAFTSDDILKLPRSSAHYSIQQADLLSLDSEGAMLEHRALDVASFTSAQLDNLCLPAVSITNSLTVTPTLDDNAISALLFEFPVTVSASGYYTASYKITDAQHRDVQLVANNLSLSKGVNTVRTTLTHKDLQGFDGPFHVESVLVYSGSRNAQSSLVGASEAYSRWQFKPYITGDLDMNGVVDGADRQLLLQFRGQPALTPGDSRDLNKDGVIDLIDARLIMQMMCAKGSCPVNP